MKTEKAIVDDKCDEELNYNELAIFDYLVHTRGKINIHHEFQRKI